MADLEKYPAGPISPPTRWSLIMAAANPVADGKKAQEALEQLCRMYWHPVLRYVIRRGHSWEDARDLTQSFFLRLCAPGFLQSADPQKGRFRSLVFASLKNLLADEWDAENAGKRKGEQHTIPWEPSLEEQLPAADLPHCAEWQADYLFDRDWAATIVRNALARLGADYAARGHEQQFAMLRPFLTSGEKGAAADAAAAALAIPAGTLRSLVHRARALYGAFLRQEVAQTLSDPAELEAEVQHLREILTALPDLVRGSTG